MWISISVLADAARAEAIADAFLARGAISASIEDANAGTAAETPRFGEPGAASIRMWPRSRVTALVARGTDIAELVTLCAADAAVDPAPEYALEEVAEQDWVRLTQSQFQPLCIGERLWIVPSWHVPPDRHATNIVLDPGTAFGTGSHPTTRLCLTWLLANAAAGSSVLDYGCGSGILAIAAAKLGARRVVAIDIDEQALAAAADNAARNAAAVQFLHSSAMLRDTFDLVVANILAGPLCVLAPVLAARVAPYGRLALSGILENQAEIVAQAYSPLLPLRRGAIEDGWVLMEGRRL